jgi:hypothetical protein
MKLEVFLASSKSQDKKIEKKKFQLTEILRIQNTWRLVHFYTNSSFYSGNVLLQFKLKKKPTPSYSQSFFKQIQVKPLQIQHILWTEIIEIAGLGISESLQVSLELGLTSFTSSAAKAQNQRWVWGKFGYLKEFQASLPEDPRQVPDLIVKIISQNSQKCLASLHMSSLELLQQGSRPMTPLWQELRTEDDSLIYPAFILIRVNLVALGRLQHFRPERLVFSSSLFEVRVVAFQAQNLEISEVGGLANPLLTVSINGVSKKTQVLNQTLNPHWNSVLIWKIDLYSEKTLKNIIQVALWEISEIKKEKKASAIVDFSSISQQKNMKPTWLSLNPKENQESPKVMIYFSIFQLKDSKEIIPNPSVKDLISSINCRLRLVIIGPRNVQGFERWMERVFVRVTVADSKPVETNVLGIKKNQKNWNFMETLTILLKIPTDPLYSPLVGFCLMGKNQEKENVVGSACLGLENFLPWAGGEEESSEDDDATDRTQISDKEIKDSMKNQKNPEKINDKWPGYQKKFIPRPEIATSFEKHFGSLLPFQTIELKKREITKELITSGFLRFKLSLSTEDDIKTIDNLSESFKKLSNLHARLNIFSLKFLPSTSKTYFIRIQLSESSSQSFETDSIQGPSAYLDLTCTLKLSLPSENFISFEVHSSSERKFFFYSFDIEERWFNQKFQKIKSSDPTALPIETLRLRNPDNSDSQVELCAFLELLTEEELRKHPSKDFKGNKNRSFELRIVVWKVKDLDFQVKDLLVRVVLNEDQQLVEETDVHFDAVDQAEFNWRIKFFIDLPAEQNWVIVELFDLKGMGNFAQARIDFQDVFEDCLIADEPLRLEKEWIRVHDGEGNSAGLVMLEVALVGADIVDQFPAGVGRESPNVDPFLPLPRTGRNVEKVKDEIQDLAAEKEQTKGRYKKCFAVIICIIFIAAIPISLTAIL